jgi:hypothetical protein
MGTWAKCICEHFSTHKIDYSTPEKSKMFPEVWTIFVSRKIKNIYVNAPLTGLVGAPLLLPLLLPLYVVLWLYICIYLYYTHILYSCKKCFTSFEIRFFLSEIWLFLRKLTTCFENKFFRLEVLRFEES